MKKQGYYSSGEFARMAQVSVRTIRFYDKQNILKPSLVTEAGARFYTDEDFARLQQILLLKFLGFSLEDIREMTIGGGDWHFLLRSLTMQKRLVQDRIEQLTLVAEAIDSTAQDIEQTHQLNGSRMLELIHLTGMEKSLRDQYQNAANVSARIRLHSDYSRNPQGWFPWIYEQLNLCPGLHVLELGCGNGALWTENFSRIPSPISLTISDVSEGMLRDARRNIGAEDERFHFLAIDCHKIPCPDQSFDLVIANHLLFYCTDLTKSLSEIQRVLKKGGMLFASTYGRHHMEEITRLVQDFDPRIELSAEKLYEHFGLENGESLLVPHFAKVECRRYEDEIMISDAGPLIEYILSCHGNQSTYLLNRYQEFQAYVERKVHKKFHITKDAGLFICTK